MLHMTARDAPAPLSWQPAQARMENRSTEGTHLWSHSQSVTKSQDKDPGVFPHLQLPSHFHFPSTLAIPQFAERDSSAPGRVCTPRGFMHRHSHCKVPLLQMHLSQNVILHRYGRICHLWIHAHFGFQLHINSPLHYSHGHVSPEIATPPRPVWLSQTRNRSWENCKPAYQTRVYCW